MKYSIIVFFIRFFHKKEYNTNMKKILINNHSLISVFNSSKTQLKNDLELEFQSKLNNIRQNMKMIHRQSKYRGLVRRALIDVDNENTNVFPSTYVMEWIAYIATIESRINKRLIRDLEVDFTAIRSVYDVYDIGFRSYDVMSKLDDANQSKRNKSINAFLSLIKYLGLDIEQFSSKLYDASIIPADLRRPAATIRASILEGYAWAVGSSIFSWIIYQDRVRLYYMLLGLLFLISSSFLYGIKKRGRRLTCIIIDSLIGMYFLMCGVLISPSLSDEIPFSGIGSVGVLVSLCYLYRRYQWHLNNVL